MKPSRPEITGRRPDTSAPVGAMPAAVDPGDLLPSDVVAEMLRVKPATLIAWRHENRGPPWIKVGRMAFYTRRDLSNWIGSQRREPAQRAGPSFEIDNPRATWG
jgi:hypothetical protein